MSRKKVIIGISIVLGIALIVGCIFIVKNKLGKKLEPNVMTTQTATPTPTVELATWDDPAGFSFQYPKGLVMNTHDEDQENYAHIELTEGAHPGKVIVWMKDTSATTISDWLKQEKTLKDAMSVDTTLGGNPALKIVVNVPKKKQIIASIDEDVVVMIEAELDDSEYWMNAQQLIAQSLSFSTSQGVSSGDGSANQAPPEQADETESLE